MPGAKVKKSQEPVKLRQPGDILYRLAVDAALQRIRHRALLEVVAKRPQVYKKYLEAFSRLQGRDFRALLDLHMLSPDAFKARHSKWLSEDSKRYGLALKEIGKPGKLTGRAKQRSS